MHALNSLGTSKMTESPKTCVVEPVEGLEPVNEVIKTLDCDEAERRSAWRNYVYRFPIQATTTETEEAGLRLFLKERLTAKERKTLTETLKEVHKRETEARTAQHARGEREKE